MKYFPFLWRQVLQKCKVLLSLLLLVLCPLSIPRIIYMFLLLFFIFMAGSGLRLQHLQRATASPAHPGCGGCPPLCPPRGRCWGGAWDAHQPLPTRAALPAGGAPLSRGRGGGQHPRALPAHPRGVGRREGGERTHNLSATRAAPCARRFEINIIYIYIFFFFFFSRSDTVSRRPRDGAGAGPGRAGAAPLRTTSRRRGGSGGKTGAGGAGGGERARPSAQAPRRCRLRSRRSRLRRRGSPPQQGKDGGGGAGREPVCSERREGKKKKEEKNQTQKGGGGGGGGGEGRQEGGEKRGKKKKNQPTEPDAPAAGRGSPAGCPRTHQPDQDSVCVCVWIKTFGKKEEKKNQTKPQTPHQDDLGFQKGYNTLDALGLLFCDRCLNRFRRPNLRVGVLGF
ncbi:uncharacterized protein LOC142075847 isoform X1 [Calonectris borealis]|uniref:uncharacterized protein LOC142075847 isoform X1 n=1 Tax=Calonectris borealis TaxID=1323832 RepID=UPI003F4C4EBB